jgi:hypothetical protein
MKWFCMFLASASVNSAVGLYAMGHVGWAGFFAAFALLSAITAIEEIIRKEHE